MKNFSYALYIMFCIFIISCSTDNDKKKSDNNIIEIKDPVPLADPFILLYNDKYYAYGTHSENGIEVYESDDLKEWYYAGLALKKENSYGNKWFWAPEIAFINGKFYMYYSADEHICCAISDSPTGPFIQENQIPMFTDEKSIDNSLFIDDDGTPYMAFVRFNDGNNVWIAELEKDYVTIKKNTLHACIHVSQKWEEVWPKVNEGPFIIKHNGTYYMTYSANSYESQMYGVGCATTKDLMGEWKKYNNNPILQNPGNIVGVGHSAMFKDKKGNLKIVFHAHRSATSIHPREMYISDVYFENVDGVDVIRISKDYIKPEIVKR